MKKYFSGLITGILISCMLLITVFAAADITAIPNPFPIKVNGKTIQVEAYSINGRTYFNGRDISKNFGASIEFNEKNRVIEIKVPTTWLQPQTSPAAPTKPDTVTAPKSEEPAVVPSQNSDTSDKTAPEDPSTEEKSGESTVQQPDTTTGATETTTTPVVPKPTPPKPPATTTKPVITVP